MQRRSKFWHHLSSLFQPRKMIILTSDDIKYNKGKILYHDPFSFSTGNTKMEIMWTQPSGYHPEKKSIHHKQKGCSWVSVGSTVLIMQNLKRCKKGFLWQGCWQNVVGINSFLDRKQENKTMIMSRKQQNFITPLCFLQISRQDARLKITEKKKRR